MRTSLSLICAATLVLSMVACDTKKNDLLAPPAGYDPVETKGLTFNKAGLDALTLTEGEARDALVQELKAKGKFKGQAKCSGGSNTGDYEESKYGDYKLTCDAGTVLFDIELKYYLYTNRELGRPLKGGSFLEFSGTLVEFEFLDQDKPRKITATVQVDENLTRLKK